MNLELANMQLIIDDKIYDLIEIPCPVYEVYTFDDSYPATIPLYLQEGEPDENFTHFYYRGYNIAKYKAIFINNKFYYPKLVENV